MAIDRRSFLAAGGLAGLALAIRRAVAEGKLEARTWEPPEEEALHGTRWGMAIDLEACAHRPGCTACIEACHRAHNVPRFDDPKREVKWTWKEPFEHAFPAQENPWTGEERRRLPVLVMCNHCEHPPCTKVCPTRATWKRADGVVMMDWHRCIGCRYCVAACPYGSRSFNWVDPRPAIPEIDPGFPTRTKGVVEKCNLCEERLAEGRPPACVAACPEGALTFGDLGDPGSRLRRLLAERPSLRRKSFLGTGPQVFYLV